jgi:hypothetical protein
MVWKFVVSWGLEVVAATMASVPMGAAACLRKSVTVRLGKISKVNVAKPGTPKCVVVRLAYPPRMEVKSAVKPTMKVALIHLPTFPR